MKDISLSILLFFAMLAWGLAWINAKILSDYLDSYSLIFWRFLIAALSLVFVAKALKHSLKIDVKTFIVAFLAAILMLFYNHFFFKGTHLGDAGFGGVLVTTLNPILTFFAVALLQRKNLGKREYFALLLGAVGSFIMLEIWEYGFGVFTQNGIKYFLLASFTWVFITLISTLNRKTSAVVFSFYMYIAVVFIDYFFFLDRKIIPIFNFDWIFWLNLFAVSLFAVTFATTVYFLATVQKGSKYASAFNLSSIDYHINSKVRFFIDNGKFLQD